MADLCMYEIEDVVWDEFDQTGDHIVPRQGYEHGIEPAVRGDSCKKPRREVIGISSNAADCSTAKYVYQGNRDAAFQPLKNTMLEKKSWSHTPQSVFPASHDSDSHKGLTSLESDNTRISNHCFKSSKIDTIGTEFCADGPIIGERCDEVDSNSYCYSLGDISQTDNDLSLFDNDREEKESNDILFDGWSDIGNFEDVDTMFSDSTFGLGGIGNDEELSWLTSLHDIEGSDGELKSDFKFSCLELSPFKDIPEQYEPSKRSSVNDSNLESSSMSYKSSFPASEDGEPNGLGHVNFMNGSNAILESNKGFTPKKQTQVPCMHLNYGHSSDQIRRSSTFHVIKSKTNGPVSLSSKDSSRASNGVVSEISHGYSFEAPPITVDDRREKLESSCMSSGFDEISPEASSFHQLQQVMEQLDTSTKLCIRDSLYRLARSAEQRHHYANLNGGSIGDRDTGGELMADGTNDCDGFMEIETDTNPIDRSIAHLLFHRPTDSSVMSAHDGLSLNSNTMINGSIMGPPSIAEKLVCKEETAGEADKK